MNFTELTEDNYVLFAIKHYDNPSAVTKEDFLDDLRRFKYIKRLINKYLKNGEVKLHLLLNHIIIVYNVFGEAATPMLFYKIEEELWGIVKTFVVFLNRLPEYPYTYIHEIEMDAKCLKELESIANGQVKD